MSDSMSVDFQDIIQEMISDPISKVFFEKAQLSVLVRMQHIEIDRLKDIINNDQGS